MARRAALAFDRDGLAENLKVSAGRGVDALFSSVPKPTRHPDERLSSTPDLGGEPTSDRPMDATPGGPPQDRPVSAAPARSPAIPSRRDAPSVADTSLTTDTSRSTNQGVQSPREKGGVTAAKHGTTTPRHHGIVTSGEVRRLRKAVKQIGKEAATYRFTREEKDQLSDLIHTCRRQGYRTSEVEITRIAVNWLMEDYRVGGKRSVLCRVLRALKE